MISNLNKNISIKIDKSVALKREILHFSYFSECKSSIEFTAFKSCRPFFNFINRDSNFSRREEADYKSDYNSYNLRTEQSRKNYSQDAFKFKILHYVITHVVKTSMPGFKIVNKDEYPGCDKRGDQYGKQHLGNNFQLNGSFNKEIFYGSSFFFFFHDLSSFGSIEDKPCKIEQFAIRSKIQIDRIDL